jgi:hypothetical protein
MLVQVALVSQSASIASREVAIVSAALQKQVTRDFAPIWEVQATVDSFEQLADVPLGYWAIIMRDDVRSTEEAEGIHKDKDGQPFALVQAAEGWSLTASHECLEMLADPFGQHLVAGQSPAEVNKGRDRVEYLVEVCDPSEAQSFGYQVNGVLVSDFYTPHYFDPHSAAGVRYSFTGAIKKPREVLDGGYLSWHNQIDDHWYQLTWFSGSKPAVRDLGIFAASNKSWREIVDAMTPTPLRSKKVPAKTGMLYAALPAPAGKSAKATGPSASAAARATRLETQIRTLLN